MKVLVTGANGFIGKNLCISLSSIGNCTVYKFDRKTSIDELNMMLSKADIIFHLAGVNRSDNELDFQDNISLTNLIIEKLSYLDKKTPLVFSSTIHAGREDPYGRSKAHAEELLKKLHKDHGNPVYIYKLSNVFGKWCKPNYNSVVATFCHNIANNKPIIINDENTEIDLIHIGEVITSFLGLLELKGKDLKYIKIDKVHRISIGKLAQTLHEYKEGRYQLKSGHVGKGFERLLYSTFISYLPTSDFKYPITRNEDSRGVFVEMLKTPDSGQFSFFTAHPNVTRGGHYHHVKTEKFLVIEGKAKFCFKNIITNETFSLITSGEISEVVETIPGWSHDITNIGKDRLIVMLWANEAYDHSKPDTKSYEVK